MKRKLICGITALAVLLLTMIPVLSQGLLGGVKVENFAFTLEDAQGNEAQEITAGGKITAEATLTNNTTTVQPYNMILEITDKGKKITMETASGSLLAGQAMPVTVSYTFSAGEADFSGYQAEVFLWADMYTMQPLSMKAAFGENSTKLYGFQIDGEQIVYPNENNEASFGVDFEYTGIPEITAIAENLGTQVTGPDVAIEEPTEAGQRLTYTLTAANGENQLWYLNLYRSNPVTDPRNADAKLTAINKVVGISNNNNHSATPVLSPAFDPDITEYTVLVIDPIMADAIILETVNPNATIVQKSKAGDTLTAENRTAAAVYEVTSADGNVKQEYTFTYQLVNRSSVTEGAGTYSLAMKNGLDPADPGQTDVWHWYSGDLQGEGTLMAGVYTNTSGGKSTMKKVRTIFEIDVTGIPDDVQNAAAIIPLTRLGSYNTATNIDLNIYKADLADGVTMDTLPEDAVYQCFGELLETFTVQLTPIPGNGSDAYIVPLDKDELLALKAAGKNLYIGVEIDESEGMAAEVRMKKPQNDGWTSPLYVRINYN